MQAGFIIFPNFEPHPWYAVRVLGEECEVESLAEAGGLNCPAEEVMAALRGLGYRGEGIMLAPPSPSFLCAVIDDSGLRGRGRETARQFRLEAQIPLAIEDTVMDFIAGETGTLGIAMGLDQIAPTVDILEREGIAVASICPATLLIADQVCQRQDRDAFHGTLFMLDGNLEWIKLKNGRAGSWTVLPSERSALEAHLRYALIGNSSPFRIYGLALPQEIQAVLTGFSPVELVHEPSDDPRIFASRAAGRMLCGGGPPPVELRRGKLAAPNPLRSVSAPLQTAFAAAVVLLVTLGVCLLSRAERYDRLARLAEARQLETFHQVLPNQPPPAILIRRLASEEKRLMGLSGNASTLPPRFSALPLLHDTLAALPEDLRFRLLELRFEPQRLYLEGQTLDHGSADRIAAALRQATGLVVDPPHTEQPTGEDVTFTITAADASLASYGDNSR